MLEAHHASLKVSGSGFDGRTKLPSTAVIDDRGKVDHHETLIDVAFVDLIQLPLDLASCRLQISRVEHLAFHAPTHVTNPEGHVGILVVSERWGAGPSDAGDASREHLPGLVAGAVAEALTGQEHVRSPKQLPASLQGIGR